MGFAENLFGQAASFIAQFSERYAIVGERTERVALQGTRVIETTASSVVLANALACSVGTVITPFAVVTGAVCLTAVKHLSLFVEYTAANNIATAAPIQVGRPVLFPQISIGQVEHGFTEFVPLESFADQLTPGPFVFVSPFLGGAMQSNGIGPFSFAPFTLAPATTNLQILRAIIPIDLDALGIPSCAFIRFGLMDVNTVAAGTCTIIATVK